MPSISYDRKSFLIDGRRIWIVSGTIDYARTPRGLWQARIDAARQAGLNCIESAVFWNVHEPRAGEYDFEGDRDVRAFVKMVGDAGMYCILRPGPYVGDGWDCGGLPAFLQEAATQVKKPQPLKVRQSDPVFLDASARYIKALMEEVGDLQITSPHEGPKPKAPRGNPAGGVAGGYRGDAGGPIIMFQAENRWECQNPEEAEAYLVRVVSMLRQNGCKVPINSCNNFWQPVEGTFDTWAGAQGLPAVTRQLASVQSEAPPIVSACRTGQGTTWGGELEPGIDAETLLYRMAGLMGVGAQFNLAPFHGGTNLGFFGGRSVAPAGGYHITSNDRSAPLGEGGAREETYLATKRLCTFASHFGNVLAARGREQSACLALNEKDHALSVLQQSGSQGKLVTLIKSKKDRSASTELLLPNGLKLPVPIAGQRATWLLLDAKLGLATLDYSNLCPWALIDRKLLVLFGPAGADGLISIDGLMREVSVPTGRQPEVVVMDPITVVVLSREQVDASYLSKDGLVVGCDGLDADGEPRPMKGWATQTLVTVDGEATSKRTRVNKQEKAPKLSGWDTLTLKSMVEGSDSTFAPIDGPLEMERLDNPLGYGWYKLSLGKAVSGKMLVAHGGDRLHYYAKGKLVGIAGQGEGASDEPVQMKIGGDVVVLADHLARFSDGQEVAKDLKGLAEHLYTVKPVKLKKADVVKQPAGDPFAVTGYVYHRRSGDQPMAEALKWEIKPESRKPVVLEIDGLPQEAVVTVNGESVAYYAAAQSGPRLRVMLDPSDEGPFTGGKNEVKLALLEPLVDGADPHKQVRLYQTVKQITTTNKGWGFAKWLVPAGDDENWRPLPKSLPSQPAWFCTRFSVADTDRPLYIEPANMTKGQIYLNGHNVGRFWIQTREGKQVGPQQRYYLPECWLKTDGENELCLFDEHGRSPDSAKLVYA